MSRKVSQGWESAKRVSREKIDWISKNKLKFLGGVAGVSAAAGLGYYGYKKVRPTEEQENNGNRGNQNKKEIAINLANKLEYCFGTKTIDGTKVELTKEQQNIINTLKNPEYDDSIYGALAKIEQHFDLENLQDLHVKDSGNYNICIEDIKTFKNQLQ